MDEVSSSVASSQRLNILCLHGFRQNGTRFKGRLLALQKKLSNVANLVFIDAPYVLPLWYKPSANGSEQSPGQQLPSQCEATSQHGPTSSSSSSGGAHPKPKRAWLLSQELLDAQAQLQAFFYPHTQSCTPRQPCPHLQQHWSLPAPCASPSQISEKQPQQQGPCQQQQHAERHYKQHQHQQSPLGACTTLPTAQQDCRQHQQQAAPLHNSMLDRQLQQFNPYAVVPRPQAGTEQHMRQQSQPADDVPQTDAAMQGCPAPQHRQDTQQVVPASQSLLLLPEDPHQQQQSQQQEQEQQQQIAPAVWLPAPAHVTTDEQYTTQAHGWGASWEVLQAALIGQQGQQAAAPLLMQPPQQEVQAPQENRQQQQQQRRRQQQQQREGGKLQELECLPQIDGILGFSQGAAVAAVVAALCQQQHQQKQQQQQLSGQQEGRISISQGPVCAGADGPAPLPQLKFVILASGFMSPAPEHQELLQQQAPIQLPSLHVFASAADGGADRQIQQHMSEQLLAVFAQGTRCALTHGGGHMVPSDSRSVGEMKAFLQQFL